jgi:hypothetical protein
MCWLDQTRCASRAECRCHPIIKRSGRTIPCDEGERERSADCRQQSQLGHAPFSSIAVEAKRDESRGRFGVPLDAGAQHRIASKVV